MNGSHSNYRFDILVIRIDANGKLVDSAPCEMCVKFMIKFGIRNVYYSDNNGNIIAKKVKDMQKNYWTSTVTKIFNIMPIETIAFLKK